MSRIRLTWLVLAVLGTIVPTAYFLGWLAVEGGGLTGLIGAWFANPSVSGLAWDVLISATAFSLFIIYECVVKRDYLPLVCLAVILFIGLSSGLPLYLFLRSRPVR